MNFTDQQKADYVAGKAVKLENVTDKQGFHATMYIKFNPEKGRPYRYDTNPDNASRSPVQREPHAGGGEQRWQDQRGDKEPERAVAERSDRPKDARQQQQQEKPQKKTGKGMKM